MEQESRELKRDFQVTCVWCGVKIRRDQSENAFGECLQCFYRILSEKLLSQTRTVAGECVSER